VSLEKYIEGAKYCTRCSVCKWIPTDFIESWRFAQVCPSISKHNFHAYSGGGRVISAISLVEGRGDITDELKEVIYRCQLCGACQVMCHLVTELVEPLEIARVLRFRCVDEGKTLPALDAVVENVKKTGSSMGTPPADRGKWAEGLDLKDATKEKVDVLFYAGCKLSGDESFWPVARKAAELLTKAGLDVGILGNRETCCGGRVFDMGYREELGNRAKPLIANIRASGASTFVTPCSYGYSTFKQFYPMTGQDLGDVEVLHITELLDRLVKESKLEPKNEVHLRVTYHDPCHLGRLGERYEPWKGKYVRTLGVMKVPDPPRQIRRGIEGIYDPPRDLLKRIPGIELTEMERRREYAWCCGGGGGVPEAYPDFGNWTAKERIDEAKSSGAKALVTACPWCEENLKKAVMKEEEMEIYDVVELLWRSI
jgi:Fe-S oxidoreductase